MLNLKDSKISYLLVEDSSDLTSYLYSRDYFLLEIKGYYQGQFENSILAFTGISNDELRSDAIHLINYFNQSNIIVKYREETTAKRINENGSEQPLGILLYNTDSEKKSYIYDGLSFSFIEQQLYYFPKKKEDFKSGMIVECFSNNKWVEKRVVDPETEFAKMYNLLMKYNKIRIPV